MGFRRETVLQVYFACSKNEELAANYLLDHMDELNEDEDMSWVIKDRKRTFLQIVGLPDLGLTSSRHTFKTAGQNGIFTSFVSSCGIVQGSAWMLEILVLYLLFLRNPPKFILYCNLHDFVVYVGWERTGPTYYIWTKVRLQHQLSLKMASVKLSSIYKCN